MVTDLRFWKRFTLYVAATFLLLVAMANPSIGQLWLMAAALLLLPELSRIIGRILSAGLAAERRLPPSCVEGERVPITVTVTNTGSLPKFFLSIADSLPRWMRLAGEEPSLILQLWPGDSSQVTYSLEADKRGAYTLGPLRITTTDPLGFSTFTRSLPVTDEMLVYPSPLPVNRALLMGAIAHGWQDQENALTRGSGMDFHGVREYRPGDDLRRVHWRTTARVGKLVVTEYTLGYQSDIVIALDLHQLSYAHTGDGPESALEYAVKIAATLASALLHEGGAVSLLTPATAYAPERPSSDATRLPHILEMLARAEANALQTLAETLGRADSRIAPGTTLVFITPDADNPALAAVQMEYAARGVKSLGFALDAESFRSQSSGRSDVPALLSNGERAQGFGAPGPVQMVRRGDSLALAIEGLAYGGLAYGRK